MVIWKYPRTKSSLWKDDGHGWPWWVNSPQTEFINFLFKPDSSLSSFSQWWITSSLSQKSGNILHVSCFPIPNQFLLSWSHIFKYFSSFPQLYFLWLCSLVTYLDIAGVGTLTLLQLSTSLILALQLPKWLLRPHYTNCLLKNIDCLQTSSRKKSKTFKRQKNHDIWWVFNSYYVSNTGISTGNLHTASGVIDLLIDWLLHRDIMLHVKNSKDKNMKWLYKVILRSRRLRVWIQVWLIPECAVIDRDIIVWV